MNETPTTHPHLFRVVPWGQIQEGDLFDGERDGVWLKSGGQNVATRDSAYYRRIEGAITPQGWISVKDRLPEGDPGITNVLVVRNSEPRTAKSETGYWVREAIGHHSYTHWMPLPQIPAIKVGEHKVDFRKDGSIKVGCTEVSSELFEQISERRKEEMQ